MDWCKTTDDVLRWHLFLEACKVLSKHFHFSDQLVRSGLVQNNYSLLVKCVENGSAP